MGTRARSPNYLQYSQRYLPGCNLVMSWCSTVRIPSSGSRTSNSGCWNSWGYELATLTPMAWVDIFRRWALKQQQRLQSDSNQQSQLMPSLSLLTRLPQPTLQDFPFCRTSVASQVGAAGLFLCSSGGASGLFVLRILNLCPDLPPVCLRLSCGQLSFWTFLLPHVVFCPCAVSPPCARVTLHNSRSWRLFRLLNAVDDCYLFGTLSCHILTSRWPALFVSVENFEPQEEGNRSSTLEDDRASSLCFVASGKKQLKMAMSSLDADMFTGRRLGRYLHRTSLFCFVSRCVRVFHRTVVLDGDGPRLVSVSATVASERSCDESRTSSALVGDGCLRGSLRRLREHFPSGGDLLGGLPHARAPEDYVGCRRGCSLGTLRPRWVCRLVRVRYPTRGSTGC